MSDMLDSILNSHDGFSTVYQRKQARAELAQLRAQVADESNWRALWLHIIKRMGGEDDVPPTKDGFDYLLETMHSAAHIETIRDQRIAELAAARTAIEQAHIPDLIDMLSEIMDFVFSKEPCGYYCDEAVGHVDHKYTNWLRSIIGDLNTLAAHPAPPVEQEQTA